MQKILKMALFFSLLTTEAALANGQPVDVLPVRVEDGAQSLNGDWKFKYIPALNAGTDEEFHAPRFDVAAWKTIPVPGHWELQGYTEPQYGDEVKPGLGLYRRQFQIPKNWSGQRVFLRFEGVLFGFSAWVNGKPVGEWASGFNAATFDITDAVKTGENDLAVRVTTRSKGWDFDTMDCWGISGIYRDVTLFALPQLHFKDYTARTTLKPDGAAELSLDFVASGAAAVAGRLVAPDGKTVGKLQTKLGAEGRGAATIVVAKPQLWTAETPALYRLEFALQDGQKFTDRVGLRQVTIENGILKLNGVPIKLRGVDHHEIWPQGRVSTDENTHRDLELMRAANINFIRTAHYPPHPRLLELCDEMGFYVDDEVPYIRGRKNLKDPDYQDILLTRARATVMRDKNRPCVLFWSLGNENPINTLGNNAGKLVKELDPSRPITFPTTGAYFSDNYQKMAPFQDIYAPHYPSPERALRLAKTLDKPIVFTEYAHQRGLARAGTNVQGLWEVFYRNPRIAGGAVWMFQDQGLLRTAPDRQKVPDFDLMAWLDEHRYYDTHGYYAMDGLVYSDRTPQVDYWMVRKVYSPVQIAARELAIRPGAQNLEVSLENRFDFRTLAGVKLVWSLQKNGATLQNGDLELSAKPKQTQTVAIPVTLPATLGNEIWTLQLRCEDAGHSFYERTIRLNAGTAPGARWNALRAAQKTGDAKLEISDAQIAVSNSRLALRLNRKTGQMSLLDAKQKPLVTAFGPHTGRHPTINDIGKNRDNAPKLWGGSLLREVQDLQTNARKVAEGVEISVRGIYARPDHPAETVRGGYTLLVRRDGTLHLAYDYAPQNATGELLEAGFALEIPSAQSELRWLGEGPYAGYPGKDRQNEYGLFHLNRDDLYFPGNRRGVELAALCNPAGAGVVMGGNGLTLDLENRGDATILSHLALVPGDRSLDESGENVTVSARMKAETIQRIAGEFEFLPLGENWPQPLAGWFGAPNQKVAANKPFLYSYDQ